MKFKVGDRVAVYAGIRMLGRVEEIMKNGSVAVLFDDDDKPTYSYHPKQCRRLVKKHRRRLSVTWRGVEQKFVVMLIGGPMFEFDEQSEFVEARRRK